MGLSGLHEAENGGMSVLEDAERSQSSRSTRLLLARTEKASQGGSCSSSAKHCASQQAGLGNAFTRQSCARKAEPDGRTDAGAKNLANRSRREDLVFPTGRPVRAQETKSSVSLLRLD